MCKFLSWFKSENKEPKPVFTPEITTEKEPTDSALTEVFLEPEVPRVRTSKEILAEAPPLPHRKGPIVAGSAGGGSSSPRKLVKRRRRAKDEYRIPKFGERQDSDD